MRLQLYDLAGRRLFAAEREAQAGHHELHWNGRNQQGHLSPPGLYILQLGIAGDAGEYSLRRTISVAY